MRGVLFQGDRQCIVSDFADPEAGPGEVVVEMKAAAICGSDLHSYRQSAKALGERLSIIPGHEPAGVVASVGPGVSKVQPGDRVSIYHYRGCGHCRYCHSGQMMWCSERRGYGGPIHGSDADLLITDERNCLPLLPELSFIDGAFIACAGSTIWSSMKKLQPSGRDALAVFGLGPIGLTGVMIGRALGARVIGVDVVPERLRLAFDLGAEEVVDASDTSEVAAAIRSWSRGEGADLALETSGTAQAHGDIIESVCRGARIVFVGFGNRAESINPSAFIQKQLTLMGSFVGSIHEHWELAPFLVEKKIDLSRIVTHRFSLERAQEAFRVFDAGHTGKVVFEWP